MIKLESQIYFYKYEKDLKKSKGENPDKTTNQQTKSQPQDKEDDSKLKKFISVDIVPKKNLLKDEQNDDDNKDDKNDENDEDNDQIQCFQDFLKNEILREKNLLKLLESLTNMNNILESGRPLLLEDVSKIDNEYMKSILNLLENTGVATIEKNATGKGKKKKLEPVRILHKNPEISQSKTLIDDCEATPSNPVKKNQMKKTISNCKREEKYNKIDRMSSEKAIRAPKLENVDNKKKRGLTKNFKKKENSNKIEIPFNDETEKVTEIWRSKIKPSDTTVVSRSSNSLDLESEKLDPEYFGIKSYEMLRKTVEVELQRICKSSLKSWNGDGLLPENKMEAGKTNNDTNVDKTSRDVDKIKNSILIDKKLCPLTLSEVKKLEKRSGNKLNLTTIKKPGKGDKSIPKRSERKLISKTNKIEFDKKNDPSEIVKDWSIVKRLEQAFLALSTPPFPDKKFKNTKFSQSLPPEIRSNERLAEGTSREVSVKKLFGKNNLSDTRYVNENINSSNCEREVSGSKVSSTSKKIRKVITDTKKQNPNLEKNIKNLNNGDTCGRQKSESLQGTTGNKTDIYEESVTHLENVYRKKSTDIDKQKSNYLKNDVTSDKHVFETFVKNLENNKKMESSKSDDVDAVQIKKRCDDSISTKTKGTSNATIKLKKPTESESKHFYTSSKNLKIQNVQNDLVDKISETSKLVQQETLKKKLHGHQGKRQAIKVQNLKPSDELELKNFPETHRHVKNPNENAPRSKTSGRKMSPLNQTMVFKPKEKSTVTSSPEKIKSSESIIKFKTLESESFDKIESKDKKIFFDKIPLKKLTERHNRNPPLRDPKENEEERIPYEPENVLYESKTSRTVEENSSRESIELKRGKKITGSNKYDWENNLNEYRRIVRDILGQYERTKDYLKQDNNLKEVESSSNWYKYPEVKKSDGSECDEKANLSAYRNNILWQFTKNPVTENKIKSKKKNLQIVSKLNRDSDLLDVKDYPVNVCNVLNSHLYVDKKKLKKKLAENVRSFYRYFSEENVRTDDANVQLSIDKLHRMNSHPNSNKIRMRSNNTTTERVVPSTEYRVPSIIRITINLFTSTCFISTRK
ncbi:conserved hypothetical protein [Pediculus humanus corporis]|uniref:Uncharacterized protein n=1 Tax=Pediculus humanus subsp. corporis TaxID=121224 RepID=E0VTA2_PEDHC|nr:uncharacterized protein Phum_PHUM429730 [Pediculus humanus corporis]EEB16608.1 conserved hypothetical protein [Pediculus humanus corporis]